MRRGLRVALPETGARTTREKTPGGWEHDKDRRNFHKFFAMARGKMADIAGAEKKLRQAEYFLGLIERWSKNPAFLRSGGTPEHLEFLFSAALSAARSVFYVFVRIDKQKSKVIYGKWLDGLGSDRNRFDAIVDLRDEDVHAATAPAKPGQEFVEDRDQIVHVRNLPLTGGDGDFEWELPNGKKVKGNAAYWGTAVLTADFLGKQVEAVQVGREFIKYGRSFLTVARAVFPP